MPTSTSVFLNVRDIEKSLAFYRALGFKVKGEHKGRTGKLAYADLSLAEAELGLGAIDSNDDPEFREWVSTPLGAGVLVYFTVPNVDKSWRLAQAAGATVEMPITDRPYGRMFTVTDPSGYSISFITEPRARKATAKRAGKTAKAAKKVPAKRRAAKSGAKKSTNRSRARVSSR